jgi:hypothetical protein
MTHTRHPITARSRCFALIEKEENYFFENSFVIEAEQKLIDGYRKLIVLNKDYAAEKHFTRKLEEFSLVAMRTW